MGGSFEPIAKDASVVVNTSDGKHVVWLRITDVDSIGVTGRTLLDSGVLSGYVSFVPWANIAYMEWRISD